MVETHPGGVHLHAAVFTFQAFDQKLGWGQSPLVELPSKGDIAITVDTAPAPGRGARRCRASRGRGHRAGVAAGGRSLPAAGAAAGADRPTTTTSANRSFSTREFFLLKLSASEAEVASYRAGDLAARRAVLAGFAGQAPALEAASSWTLPRYIDQLEWFASASDLCRAMASLDAAADRAGLAPLHDVLSRNPGLPLSLAKEPNGAGASPTRRGTRSSRPSRRVGPGARPEKTPPEMRYPGPSWSIRLPRPQ